MSHELILLGLIVLTVGDFGEGAPSRSWKVIGGSDASEGAYPYQASIAFAFEDVLYPHCGGSIIKEYWILTAAHCVEAYDPSELKVIVGTIKLSAPGSIHQVQEVVSHADFNVGGDGQNDIALLKLSSKVVYSPLVEPIGLETEFVPENTTLLLAGWGRKGITETAPDILQQIKLKSINNKRCANNYPAPITDGQICTWEDGITEGVCGGDSGTALVHLNKEKQVGVTSMSLCGKEDKPDVFIRVSAYISWINAHIDQ